MKTELEMVSLWLGLLALSWFQLLVEGVIPRDIPVALMEKTIDSNQHYCITAENLQMEAGKKLQSYNGICCHYPKVIWKSDDKIYSEDGSVCIERSSDESDVKFTTHKSSCEMFKLSALGRLMTTQGEFFLLRKDDGSYRFKSQFYQGVEFTGQQCENVTVLQENRKASLTIGSNSYCWYAKDFNDGKELKASKEKSCCDEVTFVYKSDMSMAVRSTATGREFCLKIDGMPHGKLDELDEKKIKLSSDVLGCKGSGFVYDKNFGLLRVYGTLDKCLGQSTSKEVWVKQCSLVGDVGFRNDQCVDLSYSVSSSAQLESASSPTSSSSSPLSSSLPISTSVPVSSSSPPSSSPPSSSPPSPSPPSSSPPSPSPSSSSPSSSSPPSSSTPSSSKSSPVSSFSSISRPSSSSPSSSPSPSPSSFSLQETPSLGMPFASSLAVTIYSSSQLLPTPVAPSTSIALSSTLTVIPFMFIYDGDPVNGEWGNWANWSTCSVDCGIGARERFRYCDSPFPKNGGKDCTGNPTETARCSMPSCSGRSLAPTGRRCGEHCTDLGLVCSTSIDTGNSKDSFNAKCSLDESDKLRTMNYQPAYNTSNKKCSGYVSVPAFVECNATAPGDVRRLCNCVKNGDKGYSPWTPWSGCSLKCNGGTKSRTRICVSNDPAADECLGQTQQTADCNTQKCPIDGGFSEWSLWTKCTKTCDGGVRERNRTCSNPFPEYGGSLCYGKYIEKESCAVGFCPVNGGWSKWTEWFHCDKPCNSGQRKRERWCINPVPKYGGILCKGNGTEAVLCNTFACPNATIDVENIAFDLRWNSSFSDPSGKEFLEFAKTVNVNTKRLYEGELDTYHSVLLHNLRKGSVVASFTLYFTALDSFQTLFLMDSVNVDHYLGKLPVVQSNQTVSNITSPSVPSSAPSNVTAVANDATSINVTWDEVPLQDQNGVITGYVVFHKEMTAPEYTATATIHRGVKIQGIKAATQYAIRVLAYTSNGNGIASRRILLSTAEKAPSLPPGTLSVLTKSAFSVFIQWTPPPASGWNGVIQGYKVTIKSESGAYTREFNVNGDDVFTSIDQLIPDTFYIVDVCAFTSAGVGPCSRSYNRTFVSAPSVAPGNATCFNETSPNAITVTYDPVPLDFIHGFLKGYRIEYRAIKVGYTWESKYPVQSMMVNPFYIRATIANLLPNTVYEIQVMAVNEHGIGVKSQAFYGVTCTCPDVIHTNYAQAKPYIYRDTEGNMQGLFMILLENITSNVCGLCNGKASRIDFVNDGKNGWAEKRSIALVVKEIDDYSDINFPISGRAQMIEFIGKPYLSLISHPGMVLFTTKPTISEQVTDLMDSIARLWPIFFINLVFILVAGIVYFFLTIKEVPKSKYLFIRGALRGSYWAYVTMFTHGYGDITPSTIISRIFAVVWIFIGMVLSAILIGGLTTALTTASILPEAKLYGTEIATVQGSKEYIVGIHRNAKVNSKQNYSTIDDVYKAIKSRKVQTVLIDAFVAAGRSDLFSDNEIIARKMLQYSYTYGLVLSGKMKNAHTNIVNYISNNRQEISKMIEGSTQKFTINYATKGATSLFDPSSSVLKTNLVILSGLFATLYALGTIFHFMRIKFRRKSHVYPEKWLKESETICKEFFNKVERLHTDVEETWDNRIRHYAKLKPTN